MDNFFQRVRATLAGSDMSLFPAYEGTPEERVTSTRTEEQTHPVTGTLWLDNSSFHDEAVRLARTAKNSEVPDLLSDDGSASSEDVGNNTSDANYNQIDAAVRVSNDCATETDVLDLEEVEHFFYKDIRGVPQHNSVRTLYMPACPQYDKPNISFAMVPIGSEYIKVQQKRNSAWKRYYRRKNLINQASQFHSKKPLSNASFMHKFTLLNHKTEKSPRETSNWIDLIELQDQNPYKWSSKYITEKKMEYLRRSLEYSPSNPRLYKTYIDVVTANYPVSDQPQILEALVKKDVCSFQLWSALIMMTQAEMSRFNVPNVMILYRRFMRTIINRWLTSSNQMDSNMVDNVVIQIFHKCALFLRQSGLMEQFITMIKFMMEFNIPEPIGSCDSLTSKTGDYAMLVDYEEVILKSGLPINEIWLRMEQLRQCFYFLPFTAVGEYCADPQRIISKEDICDFIYPLKNPDNTFKLLLIILKLMKLPFVRTETLANSIDIDENSDAAEDLLAVLLQPIHLLPSVQRKRFYQFEESVYELVKDLVISPTYLSHNISHSIYERCIRDLLISLSSAYPDNDDNNRKRLVFLTLWCRFERLLLAMNKYAKQNTLEMIKKVRSRFRSVLKLPNNRNNLLLYVEYALFETEANNEKEVVKSILQNIIQNSNNDKCNESNLLYVYVTYAELLFGWNEVDAACQVLCCHALNVKLQFQQKLNKSQQLAALKILREKLDRIVNIEQNVHFMTLEQHLLPDYLILTIKAYTLLLCTMQQKKDAVEYLDKLLEIFKKSVKNERHSYLREMILEYYMIILQLQDKQVVLRFNINEYIKNCVQEYPRNFLMLQLWGTMSSALWYQIRSGFLKLSSNCISVMMLLATARFRFLKVLEDQSEVCTQNEKWLAPMPQDIEYHVKVLRQRVENTLKCVLSRENVNSDKGNSQEFGFEIYRNALLWRCYLRCLRDRVINREIRKKILLAALDACPWNKAIYLEGVVFMPEMSVHLQDLIIAKHLRLFAVSEELIVLSGGDTEML